MFTTPLRAIEDLKPLIYTPSTSQARLYYELLQKRFVQKLTQEETAEQLHVSRTSIHRLQLKAVHILARELWGQSHPDEIIPDRRVDEESDEQLTKEQPNNQAESWNFQAQNEMASLEETVPKVVSNIQEVITNNTGADYTLISHMGSQLEVNFMPLIWC
jgi:hypothetical protein